MGPSPLSAIKQGRVDQPYDTKFAFAEVNAETLHWKTNGKNQDVSLMRRLTDRVGEYFMSFLYEVTRVSIHRKNSKKNE